MVIETDKINEESKISELAINEMCVVVWQNCDSRYEWYIGYVKNIDKKMAYTSLTIYIEYFMVPTQNGSTLNEKMSKWLNLNRLSNVTSTVNGIIAQTAEKDYLPSQMSRLFVEHFRNLLSKCCALMKSCCLWTCCFSYTYQLWGLLAEVMQGGGGGRLHVEGFAVVGRVLSTSLPTTSGRCQEV